MTKRVTVEELQACFQKARGVRDVFVDCSAENIGMMAQVEFRTSGGLLIVLVKFWWRSNPSVVLTDLRSHRPQQVMPTLGRAAQFWELVRVS